MVVQARAAACDVIFKRLIDVLLGWASVEGAQGLHNEFQRRQEHTCGKELEV